MCSTLVQLDISLVCYNQVWYISQQLANGSCLKYVVKNQLGVQHLGSSVMVYGCSFLEE